MKLNLSFQAFLHTMLEVGRRFPVTSVLAVLGTIFGVWVAEKDHNAWALRILLTAILFFPVSIAVRQIEKQNYPQWFKIASNVFGLLLLVVFFVFYSNGHQYFEKDIIRYIMWFGLAVASMSVAPFLKYSRAPIEYWEYNKHIVYAIVFSFAYSAVVFIGLAIALAAVNELFSLNLNPELWLQLWAIIVGLFSTTIFLSKYPTELQTSGDDFPKEIRLLGGAVGLSLVCIYFLILYSYTLKIVISNEWPKGVISTLIVGFSTVGLITFALLYPLFLKEKKYKKIFTILFASFIPQTFVLFYAVYIRYREYGLTENRYLLIAFGVWLCLVSVYFLVSKFKDLKVIPYSLIVALLIASVSPLSAFNLSERDQFTRLKNLLVANNILIGNQIAPGPHNIPYEVKSKIFSILNYLDRYHGLAAVSKLLPEGTQMADSKVCREQGRGCFSYVAKYIGISNAPMDIRSDYFYFNIFKPSPMAYDIREYDYMVEDSSEIKVGQDRYTFYLDREKYRYDVLKNSQVISQVDLTGFIENLKSKYFDMSEKGFSQEEMSVTHSDNKVDIKIYFEYITLIDQKVESHDWKLVKFK
ncbi:MAG TPA: DUF4153 domain-containing protein [Patescibacteria group bacterium]|nr:DUF4153 domain-containing protein [Patescibacteria group bacterium]